MSRPNNFVRKRSAIALSLLLNTGALIFGISAPLLAQAPYYPPPTITPIPPGVPGQPTITPIPPGTPNQPPFYPAPSPGIPQINIQPQVVNLSINELVTQWGLTPVNCRPGVASIRQDQKTVCVNPTPQLPPGDYTYNPATNQISAIATTRPFTFVNSLQYSHCVQDILRFYQNKEQLLQQGRQSDCLADKFQANMQTGISRQQAREMIEAADVYATALVKPKLFPPRGLREQVAQQFGFIYELDVNDPVIRQMATQGNF
ncbi:hypothetical protein NIES2119_25005 [[Phormidium ambiguum] IAM M-71]|uniref:Uncharacterized protein n=1 Tax=[Phormidium ambiguum] IAM M-71 TaxID=454136 RepID=A0A1U7I8P6_9CYAN|nr:hypothetical protein [Phormidium ambiguum]OKH32838.1 hypothetical protein NIES2119_25005 [Phormidium ambiguum IAM M-71]